MRDPRLVEIDFLMDLEREVRLMIRGSGEGAAEACHMNEDEAEDRASARLYGTDPRRFRDMVHSLLLSGLIDGWDMDAINMFPRTRLPEDLRGLPVCVRMNHAGRVHLWNMRDALLRDPDLEPFGLRSMAAWERDLFVRLKWASPEAPLSLIFLDLDNFGMVNKVHGHTTGNAVLRLVFQLVSSAIGTRGTVYRCGGEEVGVLLPSTALEEAKRIAEEIRSLIEREVHMQVEVLKTPQTVSMGVASFTVSVENDVAVTKVDTLMRGAKEAGKNRVEVGT